MPRQPCGNVPAGLGVEPTQVLIAHLSDSHLRDAADLRAFGRQLDRVVAAAPDHLVLSGDLLDRWNPRLLASALDALAARSLLDPSRVTIIHGNHDLQSSGGHPRSRRDLPRLVLRAWDLPPVVAARRRRFYEAIARRASGVAHQAPFAKDLGAFSLAAIDTIPLPWTPIRIRDGRVQTRLSAGCVRDSQLAWLRHGLPPDKPSVLVLHHYPLAVPSFRWGRRVEVVMEIPERDRRKLWAAARAAGVRLVLCGHVHRARLDWHEGIAVGLQGQSGAGWAGNSIGWYEVRGADVRMRLERTA
ncbi:MAG TPA: metallophosphoesterase [Vicinamibacterales bacterium]|jgi:3',5'-cyclic AMP phosphodiesterase CpdA